MAGRIYHAVDRWFKSKNVFEILLDVIASVGIAVTVVMARGNHSLLHEFLAGTNYVTCLLLIGLKRPYKYIQVVYIIVIFVVAVLTGGFK